MDLSLPHTVVFDLDGTLVDSATDLAVTMNHCMALESLPPLSESMVKHLVGHGARKLIETGLAHHRHPVTPERFEELVQHFFRYYTDNMCVHTRPYPGLVDALERLRARDITLAICTNKATRLSEELVRSLRLDGYFAAILGGDALDVRKPDARHLLETIARAGGNPSTAVMVGDSIVDAQAGQNAGVPVIAVTFGFSDVPPDTFGAQALLDHYDDFDTALASAHGSR